MIPKNYILADRSGRFPYHENRKNPIDSPNKRKQSSRMRIARSSTVHATETTRCRHLGYSSGWVVPGVYGPVRGMVPRGRCGHGGLWSQEVWSQGIDACEKHYLSATSLTGGKNYRSEFMC